MDKNFITIVGQRHFRDMEPYSVGSIVKLVKDFDNICDTQAIRVEDEEYDTVGYVANSRCTVFDGTNSADAIYNKIGEFAFARVEFITYSGVIARILTPDDTIC